MAYRDSMITIYETGISKLKENMDALSPEGQEAAQQQIETYTDSIIKRCQEQIEELTKEGTFVQGAEEKEQLNQKQDYYEKKLCEKITSKNLSSDVITCLEMLSPLESYSIGSHVSGLTSSLGGASFSGTALANSIIARGLLSNRREGGGVARTVHILGNEDIENKLRTMLIQFYSHTISCHTGGAVVAIPSTLISSPTERMWIGEFPNDLEHSDKDAQGMSQLPINKFVDYIGYVPSEFIVGVISQAEDGSVTFTKNPRFISQLSIEEQIAVYNKFVSQGLQAAPPEKAHLYRK